MAQEALAEFVEQAAEKFGVPGAAIGVWHAGQEFVACHGVTSLADPLPVDRHTAFPLGSISKTFTATAVMRLVADGTVELDAPVRRYLPDLRLSLAEEPAAEQITILNLLNHTSGLEWNLIDPYELDVMELVVATDGQRLTLAVGIKPEVRASSDADMPQDYPAAEIRYLPGDGDDYLITDGGLAGQRGCLTRDSDGVIVGIDLAGRMFQRTAS